MTLIPIICPVSEEVYFVAGTMFIAKAPLFQPLKDLNIPFDAFPLSDGNRALQLAHILERFMGYMIYQQGYQIADFKRGAKIKLILRRFLHFLYHKKITKSGKILIKCCKIPVYCKFPSQ